MNALSFVALAVMVAAASAQGPADLMGAVGAVISGQVGPETLCKPFCAANCMTSRTFCISVPPLVNCDALSTACGAACDDLCGCFEDCPKQCDNKCGDLDPLTGLVCKANELTCVGVCSSKCPINAYTSTTIRSLKMVMMATRALLAPPAP